MLKVPYFQLHRRSNNYLGIYYICSLKMNIGGLNLQPLLSQTEHISLPNIIILKITTPPKIEAQLFSQDAISQKVLCIPCIEMLGSEAFKKPSVPAPAWKSRPREWDLPTRV